MYDILRLDHFRGFFAYWQVPANQKTAVSGRWVKGPGEHFFNKLFERFPKSRFIAEDLGYITADVRAAIKKYNLTSTKVLLFAFGRASSTNPHLLKNYPKNSVVYTSTHDNNTARGWFEKEANPANKKKLFDYIGRQVPALQISRRLIHLAMNTVSDMVIIPVQDILGFGELARMNRPATVNGNWKWRLLPGALKNSIAKTFRKLTYVSGRL
jgi:4-alpha-glucanotransferase